MPRYKLTLEYDGTDLIGWQENATGPSVQSLLQDALFKFCGERVDVVSAGRTDAGVHAIAMAASFELTAEQNPETMMRALNFYLGQMGAPVAVLSCESAADDFHARFSCKRRHYRYIILNRRAPVILDRNRVWWIPRPLDVAAMRAAAAKLVGHHDWTSFRSSECQAKSPLKTLDKIEIYEEDCRGVLHTPRACAARPYTNRECFDFLTYSRYIILNFSARSFLHHQVRNMVGTLVEIGLGKPLDIDAIFAAKSRSAAGPTAPAGGLYFVGAEY